MAKAKMPHPGHAKHMCYLTNVGFHRSNVADYRAMVRGAKFICKNCGRTAVKEINLCSPVKL